MSEYIILDQYMKIQKTGNDFIYMKWPKLSNLMISLGWIDKEDLLRDMKSFSAYHYKWENIGLKYIQRTLITTLHFEVVDKHKFTFTVLKHCHNLDGIHYHT